MYDIIVYMERFRRTDSEPSQADVAQNLHFRIHNLFSRDKAPDGWKRKRIGNGIEATFEPAAGDNLLHKSIALRYTTGTGQEAPFRLGITLTSESIGRMDLNVERDEHGGFRAQQKIDTGKDFKTADSITGPAAIGAMATVVDLITSLTNHKK